MGPQEEREKGGGEEGKTGTDSSHATPHPQAKERTLRSERRYNALSYTDLLALRESHPNAALVANELHGRTIKKENTIRKLSFSVEGEALYLGFDLKPTFPARPDAFHFSRYLASRFPGVGQEGGKNDIVIKVDDRDRATCEALALVMDTLSACLNKLSHAAQLSERLRGVPVERNYILQQHVHVAESVLKSDHSKLSKAVREFASGRSDRERIKDLQDGIQLYEGGYFCRRQESTAEFLSALKDHFIIDCTRRAAIMPGRDPRDLLHTAKANLHAEELLDLQLPNFDQDYPGSDEVTRSLGIVSSTPGQHDENHRIAREVLKVSMSLVTTYNALRHSCGYSDQVAREITLEYGRRFIAGNFSK